jgi:nicotinamidase-related amidase
LYSSTFKSFHDPSWGERNNPRAEENALKLLAAWRSAARPIAHVRHLSPKAGSLFHKDSPTSEFKYGFLPEPGEPVFVKSVNSAFIGTRLEAWLRAKGIQQVIIAGLTTPHCVSTTARMAGNLGFTTFLVADATAAFAVTGPDGHVHPAEEIHRVSLATLHEEFASILNTDIYCKLFCFPMLKIYHFDRSPFCIAIIQAARAGSNRNSSRSPTPTVRI